MLDLGKKYYVRKNEHSEDEVRNWAEVNGMHLNGAELVLGSCGKVYGLDVWNGDVLVSRKLQGARFQRFLNGTKQIGVIYSDSGVEIISPAIRSR